MLIVCSQVFRLCCRREKKKQERSSPIPLHPTGSVAAYSKKAHSFQEDTLKSLPVPEENVSLAGRHRAHALKLSLSPPMPHGAPRPIMRAHGCSALPFPGLGHAALLRLTGGDRWHARSFLVDRATIHSLHAWPWAAALPRSLLIVDPAQLPVSAMHARSLARVRTSRRAARGASPRPPPRSEARPPPRRPWAAWCCAAGSRAPPCAGRSSPVAPPACYHRRR
jgi:hypothetical protein